MPLTRCTSRKHKEFDCYEAGIPLDEMCDACYSWYADLIDKETQVALDAPTVSLTTTPIRLFETEFKL